MRSSSAGQHCPAAIRQTAFEEAAPSTLAAGPPEAPAVAPQPAAEPLPAPMPVSAVTLDEAMQETLQSDPKLRAAMELIKQARADFATEFTVAQSDPGESTAISSRCGRFTPAAPGGPPELDVIATFPDRLVALRQAGGGHGQRTAGCFTYRHADYSDQVRQRLANTAAAFSTCSRPRRC